MLDTRMIASLIRGLAASLLATSMGTLWATDIEWDATHYLRVPVRLGSDTRLVMPEPFDDVWERDDELSASLLDARTLIIRPRIAKIEQRLTLRGRISGTLYLARVSSSLPYTPIVSVHGANRAEGTASEAGNGLSVTALLRTMMLGRAPPGVHVEKTTRVLLDEAPYHMVAEELWQSFKQSGIIARVTSTIPQRTVPIVPANIQIRIPQLGALRAMAADAYEIGPHHLSARVYLVYGH
jgi:hypothetical protein